MLTDNEIEYWFTANGNHIPVKKGQSKEQALSEFLKSKGDVQGYNSDELSQKIRTRTESEPNTVIDTAKMNDITDKINKKKQEFSFDLPRDSELLFKNSKTKDVVKLYERLESQGIEGDKVFSLLDYRSSIYKDMYKSGILTKEEIYALDDNDLAQYAAKCDELISNHRQEIKDKRAEENREREKERQAAEQSHAAEIKNIAARYGVIEETANKITEINKKAQEKHSQSATEYRYHTSDGYGTGKSTRALKAELEGRYSLSQCSQILGISTARLKNILPVSKEWHHTGALYNKTQTYDISAILDIVDDMTSGEKLSQIKQDYGDENIQLFNKLFGTQI